MQKGMWTVKEYEILRQYYETGSKEEIMALLPERSWHAIGGRANQLGLDRLTRKRHTQEPTPEIFPTSNKKNLAIEKHYDPWTFEELEILANHFSTTPNEELITLFPGRTLDSIKQKAYNLGLRTLNRKPRRKKSI